MSDLTTFRDHCRAMAASETRIAAAIEIQTDEDLLVAIRFADDADLWTRLADEVDHYLEHGLTNDAPEEHTQPLWETT